MVNIPVVFCCNRDYYPIFLVAFYSLCDHVSKECIYCVFVITDDPYIDMQNKKLNQTIEENVEVRTILLQDNLYDRYFTTKQYYSKETYYRLMIAELLPQFEKVIYLDCDICILGDLKELYDISLDHKALGMAKAITKNNLEFIYYVKKELKLNPSQYYNAGVLLINTKAFQEQRCFQRAIALMKNGNRYMLQDQDILNVVCQKNIKTISNLWNYRGKSDRSTNFFDIKIIHYISNQKPWNSDAKPYDEIFWKYAKRTEYYEKLLQMKFQAIIKEYV